MPSPELLSTAEAAGVLQRSVATVNRWAAEGRLPEAIKADGLRGPRFFARSDVERLRDELAAAS